MRRPLAGLLIAMMTLSACAGPGRDRPSREAGVHDQTKYRQRDQTTSSSLDHGEDYEATHHSGTVRHYHDEPVPDDYDLYQAGQIAMMLSASVFACAFFVVILDGACNFNVGTSYYY